MFRAPQSAGALGASAQTISRLALSAALARRLELLPLKVMNYRRNHVASNAVVKMEEQQQMEKILCIGSLFP
jgi:hypothetical protein